MKKKQQRRRKFRRRSVDNLTGRARPILGAGFCILPVVAGTKRPLTKNGVKDATDNFEIIRQWGRQWPDANVGIATGNGLVVLDVDGHAGRRNFRRLCKQYGINLPATYNVATPRGRHYYLNVDPEIGIRNSASKLDIGIDVRGDGGYVVAAGSVVDGKSYVADGDLTEIQDCPPQLLCLLTESRKKTAKKRRPRQIYEGERNDFLFNIACRSDSIDEVRERNSQQCSPPLSDEEVEKLFRSSRNYQPISDPDGSDELTDLGNAKRIVRGANGKLIYITELAQWRMFNGRRWTVDVNAAINLAKKNALRRKREAANIEHRDESKNVFNHAIKSQQRAALTAAVELAKSEPRIARSINDFSSDAYLLPTANRVVNLRTGEARKPTPSDLFLKSSPVLYKRRADCPLWRKTLTELVPDKAVRRYLRKAIGLTLTADVTQEVAFFLYGPGGTGKTTVINVMKALLGDLAQTIGTHVLLAGSSNSGSERLSQLVGARMVTPNEIPEGARWNEAKLKDLSSRDPLNVKELYKNPFSFSPTHKLWLYGNHKPRAPAFDSGFWRRLKLIPFSNPIPENRMDRDLDKKLQAELSGILNWAIEGCRMFIEEGLRAPKAVSTTTDEYRDQLDTLGRFINERVHTNDNRKTKASALYAAYKNFCKENSEYILNNVQFSDEMQQRGFKKKKLRNGNYYIGLKLRTN